MATSKKSILAEKTFLGSSDKSLPASYKGNKAKQKA
jgi:hypothetical protein